MSDFMYNPCLFCGVRNCLKCQYGNTSVNKNVRIIEKFDKDGKIIEKITEYGGNHGI